MMTERHLVQSTILACWIGFWFCIVLAVSAAAHEQDWLVVFDLALAVVDIEVLAMNYRALQRLPPNA